jgi:mercuric ion transport protein
MSRALVWFGSGFGILGLICCFTPLLPVLLGGVLMGGFLSLLYQDAVLLPIAAGGFVLAAVGLWLGRRNG